MLLPTSLEVLFLDWTLGESLATVFSDLTVCMDLGVDLISWFDVVSGRPDWVDFGVNLIGMFNAVNSKHDWVVFLGNIRSLIVDVGCD